MRLPLRVEHWHTTHKGTGPRRKRGPVLDRVDTVAFDWPQNLLCRRRGHRPVRATVAYSTVAYPRCARCGRRPLWWGTIAQARGATGHPLLAAQEYRQRPQWVGFTSWDAFLEHVARGRPVAWPGEPRVLTTSGDDDRPSARERFRLHTYFRTGYCHQVGASFRLDGPGAETPIDVAVHLGALSLYGSTDRLGARLAERIVPDGQNREVAATVSLGNTSHRLLHTAVQWSLWTDRHSSGQGWRDGYTMPLAAVADRVWGKAHTERQPIAGGPELLTLRMPEGDYTVQAQLLSYTETRPRGRKVRMRFAAQLTTGQGQSMVTGGNPWKGGTTGWSVPITDPAEVADGRWKVRAAVESVSRFLLERAQEGGPDWVPTPEELEAYNT